MPWDIPFSLRCSTLRENINKGYMISILIYECPDMHTFRYRGYNMMQITQQNNSSLWKCVYFFRHELNALEILLHKVHFVTIIRMKWNHELDDFIVKAKKQNVRVLFDIDDLVFDLNYLPLLYNTLNINPTEADYDYWFSYFSRFNFTASKADAFITTNDYLGQKIKNKYKKEVYSIPNFLNQEQIEISNDLCRQKANVESKKPFTIGYFSGTPSHINDFKIIYKELLELLIDYKIKLLVVGFMEFPSEMREFIDKGQILYTPLVDFIELQKQLAQVDVNIVPLVNNTFTNCKSELKYFEAAIVKTITLATPTFAYQYCIKNGINGYLCKEGEWYDKIMYIYKNIDTKKNIEDKAYEDAIQGYTGNVIIRKINEAYSFLASTNYSKNKKYEKILKDIPKISVIIPVYNAEKYLEHCIMSILSQTFKYFECLIVDDCSTDRSLELCNNFAQKDSRIKIIHREENGGVAQARKTGIENIITEYTLFIDNDDWIEPTMLEELYTKMITENYDMVCCDFNHEFDNQTVYSKQDPEEKDNSELIKQIISWGDFLPVTWNKLIRTEIYRKIIFPSASYSEDRGIMVQVLQFTKKIGYVNKSLYHWNHVSTSLSRKKSNAINNLIDDYKVYVLILCFINNNISNANEYVDMILFHIDNLGFLCSDNQQILDAYKRSINEIIKRKLIFTTSKIVKEQKKFEKRVKELNKIMYFKRKLKKIIPRMVKDIIKGKKQFLIL